MMIDKNFSQAPADSAGRKRGARELSAEYKKQRCLFIWLIPLAFLAILFLWGTVGQRNLSDYDLAQGYSYLLFQFPVLNCIFMPVMLAVVSSRSCDMEIKGQTAKLLFTLQNKGSFYDRKFFTEFLYLLLFSLGELVIMLLYGKLYQYTETLPARLLLRHLAATLLAGTVVLTLQHLLSLLSKNQIIPLLTGLLGAFVGLFSEFFPPVLARLVPWGYFSAFLPFSMEWDETASEIALIPRPFDKGLFAGFLGFGVLLYLLCRYIFVTRED